MRCVLALALLITSAPLHAQEKVKPQFEFEVWAGPKARSDSRVVRTHSHRACGAEVAVIRANRMPMPTGINAPLQPELVVELDTSGKIVRHWGMPVDSIVSAVAGDRIIVPIAAAHAGARALAISSNGSLARTTVPEAPRKQSTECPLITAFEGSAYVRCFRYKDLRSAETRTLAYQGPCT